MEFQRRDLLKTLQLEGDVVPLNPLPGRCPGPDPQKILGFGYPLLEALIIIFMILMKIHEENRDVLAC